LIEVEQQTVEPPVKIPTQFGGIPCAPVRTLQTYVRGLIYGRPGAGKTTLVSQASKVPAMSPLLHMTSDASEADTLFKAAPNAIHLPITKWSEFWDVYHEAAKGIRDPSKIPFRTIVIDTGTEAERMWMRDIMTELEKNGRPSGGEVNIDVPSVREWGQSISGMRRIFRAYRDLPVNFLVTAHETEMRDNKGVTWFKPDFPGKLKNQASGMFPNVWYIYTKADEEMDGRRKIIVAEHRLLLTGFTEGFVCKTRADTLPRVVQNPSMDSLYAAVTGRSPITGEVLPSTDDRTELETVSSTREKE
jgi:AAA domain